MVSFTAATAAISALAFASFSNAQLAAWSNPSVSDYSVKLNIPESGNDIFLQLNGPASAGWVGTGIGSQMRDALIFVIYQDGTGNVTVSPRLGVGNIEPEFESSINYELLGGSGVSDGVMTANIRCGNCRTWSTGSLNVASTNENFIWAVGNNEDIVDTDPDADIRPHRLYGFYTLNLVAATGGTTVNPFVNSDGSNISPSTTGSTTSTGTGTGTTISTGTSISPPRSKADKILIAHGVIMAVTFVLLFPFGAALIRLLNNRIPNAFALHRGVQILNLILAFIGLGMGVWRCNINHTHWRTYHQVMGVVIVCLLPLQAVLGSIHHIVYLKTQKRSFWSYGHIWFGRIVIILGIINGGIGLGPELADAPRGWIIAYIVVVSLVAVLYGAFYLLKKRSRENKYAPTHQNNYAPAVQQDQWH